jgi:hypothetical protein
MKESMIKVILNKKNIIIYKDGIKYIFEKNNKTWWRRKQYILYNEENIQKNVIKELEYFMQNIIRIKKEKIIKKNKIKSLWKGINIEYIFL